jgi:hypothetical protein
LAQSTVGWCGRAGGAWVSDGDRPNILVIWGDDIGITNLIPYGGLGVKAVAGLA